MRENLLPQLSIQFGFDFKAKGVVGAAKSKAIRSRKDRKKKHK